MLANSTLHVLLNETVGLAGYAAFAFVCVQRAAQIRSTPFTGDSSSESSSDEDEYYSQVAVTTSPSENDAVMSVAGPSSTNVTMSMAVRKAVNLTSSGATKRGGRLFMLCSKAEQVKRCNRSQNWQKKPLFCDCGCNFGCNFFNTTKNPLHTNFCCILYT